MTLEFQIGGYRIRLQEREGHPSFFWPVPPFDSFLVQSAEPPDLDFEVKVTGRLPDLPHGRLIFDASHGLWKLYAADSGYLLESPDPSTLEPRSRALISEDFSRIEVWVYQHQALLWKERVGWAPLHIINPTVEVCLVTRLAREGGLFFHAAGVLTKRGGEVFTGASGAGKSTIAHFLEANGGRVLNDERVILRKDAGAYLLCGTPWWGDSQLARNQQGRLTGLYCIRHGEGAHALRRLPARDISLFILRQCVLPHWDRQAMDGTLAFLSELIEHVECFDLAFLKNPDIVDYLEERRLTQPAVPS
jgi:hypothetical protein